MVDEPREDRGAEAPRSENPPPEKPAEPAPSPQPEIPDIPRPQPEEAPPRPERPQVPPPPDLPEIMPPPDRPEIPPPRGERSWLAEPPEVPIEVPKSRLAAQSRRDFMLFAAGVAA